MEIGVTGKIIVFNERRLSLLTREVVPGNCQIEVRGMRQGGKGRVAWKAGTEGREAPSGLSMGWPIIVLIVIISSGIKGS